MQADDELRVQEPAGPAVGVAKLECENDQLKQQAHALCAKVKEAQDQVQQHQILVQNATAEVEALQTQVRLCCAEVIHSRTLAHGRLVFYTD